MGCGVTMVTDSGDVAMVPVDVTTASGLGDVFSAAFVLRDETCCLARSLKLSTAFNVFGLT